jgi:serine/threonine protein phosphatase PrpC
MTFQASGATHIGHKRKTNADQYLIGEMQRVLEIKESSVPSSSRRRFSAGPAGYLLVVADGVGSSSAGDQASAVAVETMIGYLSAAMQFSRTGVSLEEDLLEEFTEAICRAHHRLVDEVKLNPALKGMATTLTMAYILGLRAYIGHVGDSRCYLVRDGEAKPITKDQTFAQVLIDQGVLTKTRAEGSRWSHVLASAVGGDNAPEVLTYMLALKPTDALVLCTDGLVKHVRDADIGPCVGSRPAVEAARSLIDAALADGGSDNVTVVVGRFA